MYLHHHNHYTCILSSNAFHFLSYQSLPPVPPPLASFILSHSLTIIRNIVVNLGAESSIPIPLSITHILFAEI